MAQINKAISDVANASKAYGIPRSTLHDALAASHKKLDAVRRQILGAMYEAQLNDYAMKMYDLYYGITISI